MPTPEETAAADARAAEEKAAEEAKAAERKAADEAKEAERVRAKDAAAAKAKLDAAKKAEKGKIQVFGGVEYSLMDAPAGTVNNEGDCRERRLLIGHANYEHVDDDPVTGTWRYRQMP